MTIFAAGALCWREVEGKLMVAVIYRNRYKDWSWPKGKVDPGESLPEAAVREIREETGLKVKLGIPLSIQAYTLPNGDEKEVYYWTAHVTEKAIERSKFKPDEEVERVEWKLASEVRDLLTYPDDAHQLDELLAAHKSGALSAKPFIVLRHAKATPRSDWKKGETSRPLLKEGELQAKALIPLLNAFGVKQVISSPWRRCQSTVEPFAKKRNLKIVERGQLTEFGEANGPQRTSKTITKLIESQLSTVVCSHRPALPTIFNELAKNATSEQKEVLTAGHKLEPGEMMVVHITSGKNRKIAAIETWSPIITNK